MNVTILYGSATGNAEQIARRLAATVNDPSSQRDDHHAFFTTADVMEMNKFKTRKLFELWSSPPPSPLTTNTNDGTTMMKKHAIVMVCSTTGNGDPPENATRFVRHIKKPTPTAATSSSSSSSSPTLPLTNVAYSVLALGDTNYDKFCEAGKVLDKKFADWGGKRAHPLVCADEATGLEDTVEPWMERVLDKLALAACYDVDSNDSTLLPVKSNGSTIIVEEEEEEKKIEHASDLENVSLQHNVGGTIVATTINEVTTIKSTTPLYILYGSATGNAEHIAKDLTATYQSELNNPALVNTCYFPSVICCELNQYKRKCLSDWSSPPHPTNTTMKHGVLVVCSTTGNANAPENADRFVRAIKRETNTKLFGHVAYAVLGLGDTNYDVFNATAKLIDKQMSELGGTRVQKATLADEATGLEDIVEPWKESIFSVLAAACRGGGRLDPTSNVVNRITDNPHGVSHDVPSTKLNGSSIPSSTEEKKDPDDVVIDDDNTSTTKHDVNNSSGPGVSTIRKLLCIPDDSVLPSVPTTSLPCVISCLSSCKLFNDEDDNNDKVGHTHCDSESADNVTISSASSGFLFTANRPYESVVIDARYLTGTDVSCAKKVATEILCGGGEERGNENEKLIRAMKMYDNHFPISASKFDGWQKKLQCEKNSKRVIEMTLSLPDDFTLDYQPGDSVGLIVSNTPESTQLILDMLQRHHGILPTQKVSVDAANPITVEEVVRCNIDLCSPMKKKGLYLLSDFAQDPEERKALQWLSGKSGNLYEKFVEQQHRTIIDILQDFPSCQVVTLDGLLGCLSAIPPRYYSICSSPLQLDTQNGSEFSLKVAFSVVDYYTPVLAEDVNSCRRVGGLATRRLECICSPYLDGQEQMTTQSIVRIFPKPTIEFRLPSDMSTPLILIGPGTGIAPFIGFLSHRQAQLASLGSCVAAEMASEGIWRGGYELEREELALSKGDARGLNLAADYLSSNQQVGDIDLFFGCRRSDHDYLYKNELEMYKSSGILTNLYTAFSREEGMEKKYVQTIMQNNVECGKRVVEMIMNKGASVYICGDGNVMGKDVQETIISLLATDLINNGTCTNLDEATDRATSHVDQMKTTGRFVLDIWS